MEHFIDLIAFFQQLISLVANYNLPMLANISVSWSLP
jgi:hypothetical protein